MFSLLLLSKFFTCVALMSFVYHSCSICAARVSLVLFVSHLGGTCVVGVALVSLMSGTHVVK